MTSLRLFTAAAVCIMLWWPIARAAAPAVVPRWADQVLYFAIVDRFADDDAGRNVNVDRTARGAFHGGDLKGLREHLGEIAYLGVTALWITPVVKNIDGFVTGASFPDWAYHGYWAEDFTRLDRRFGSEEDLATLARACDERGIKLLLDVVYNPVGYGSGYLTGPATRTWFRSPDAGTCGDDDVTSCVAGLPDLRTELPQVARHLMDAHLGLARRVGLEGFRLDTVKHVPMDFWQAHRAQVRERLGADFFLLGEVWGGDGDVLDPWFAADAIDAGGASRRRLARQPQRHAVGNRAIRPGAGLPRDETLRADYRRLIAIRRPHPSLWRGRRESIRAEGDLLVFARHDDASGDSAIVAVNRGEIAAGLKLPLPPVWSGRTVHDPWRGTPAAVHDSVLTATVPGRQPVIVVSRGGQP